MATLIPEAGEGSLTFLPDHCGEHSDRWLAGERCIVGDGEACWYPKDSPTWRAHAAEMRLQRRREGPPADPERSMREACRRATQQARLIAKVNRTDRLVTLTYRGGGERSLSRCRRDYRAFRRRAAALWPDLVTLAFPEPHPSGHGWHVHILINRYLPKNALAALWGHGFVDIRRARGASGKMAAGELAAYVAKYVAKTAEPGYAAAAGVNPRQLGQHRYWPDGYLRPWVIRRRFASSSAAERWLREKMGALPESSRPFAVDGTSISGWVYRWPERYWWRLSVDTDLAA